jgi:hypothetical protein
MSRDKPGRIVLELQPEVPASVAQEIVRYVLAEYDTAVYAGMLADADGFGRIVHYPDTRQQ